MHFLYGVPGSNCEYVNLFEAHMGNKPVLDIMYRFSVIIEAIWKAIKYLEDSKTSYVGELAKALLSLHITHYEAYVANSKSNNKEVCCMQVTDWDNMRLVTYTGHNTW